MNAVQPCDFASSPVSSSILVLTQPSTSAPRPPELVQSVRLASKPNCTRATPREVIAKLNAAIVDALAEPAVRTQLAKLGLEVPPREQQSPEVLGTFQKAEIDKWWPIIKETGIKPE